MVLLCFVTLQDGSSDLIYYERDDKEGPKLSTYSKVTLPSESTDQLNSVLLMALGDKGIVKKKRQLFMHGQTRIHVDSVDGLGDFMELEVPFVSILKISTIEIWIPELYINLYYKWLQVGLKDEETPEDGVKIAHSLMEKLGVDKKDLIAGAYRDLLAKNTE